MSATAQPRETTTHSPGRFVVTTLSESGERVLKSELWDPETPLGLGHPLRWILDRTDSGVRIRDVEAEPGEIIRKPIQEVSDETLARGAPVQLKAHEGKGARRLWLLIHPVRDTAQIAASAAKWQPPAIPSTISPAIDTNRPFTIVSLTIAALFFTAYLIIRSLPPKKAEEELIPPQFAKLLLQPAKQKVDKKAEMAAAARKNNVVKAFESEAVKKTAKTLLAASAVNALLAGPKSLQAAASKAMVRGVFDSKSSLAISGALTKGALEVPGAGVTYLGGEKGGGGYGSEATGVAGQGDSLLTLSGGSGTTAGLTRGEVAKVIRENLSEVRYCYEAGLMRNSSLEGRLVVQFIIRSTGLVGGETAKESSGDAALDTCILARLAKWKFPKPKGGVDVGVTYPFIFKSLGD